MGQINYELVPPHILTQYVRQYDNEILKPQAKFVLGQWLPDLFIDDLEYRIRKASLQDVDAAEYRAWDTPGKLTGRPGITRIQGEIGPMSRGILLGEEERLRTRSLLAGTDDPIIHQIYEDAERMMRSLRIRMELAIGDVINDGAVDIIENGLHLAVDFDRDPSMSETAGTLWTNHSGAVPVTDLMGWQETYLALNGELPGVLVVPRARLSDFALNAEMRSFAAANGTTPVRLNLQAINDTFASEGLPPVFVYDGIFRVNGTQTRVLPANKVFLMPAAGSQLGNLFIGTTAESLILAQKGLITASEAPGIVAFVLTQDYPVQTTTYASGVSLPVMPNPNLVMDCVVAA